MRKTKTTNLTSKTKKWVATYREKARKTMTKSHITINFTSPEKVGFDIRRVGTDTFQLFSGGNSA